MDAGTRHRAEPKAASAKKGYRVHTLRFDVLPLGFHLICGGGRQQCLHRAGAMRYSQVSEVTYAALLLVAVAATGYAIAGRPIASASATQVARMGQAAVQPAC